ncbi:fumarylacetoacetate hydrolase family protein [Falsigemmobacter faecalis]|uniref:FAA hydrolase family protein n=1 Tax=Falsigemmobacter faecalis TaxID=2488730 RepID=A0A3P3DET2_9RHOB|nr:fumarylacetoacetate hydrolase family protein [Falsigemmobacter faecalis]RRH72780.1 FAA hydrolase family protein [Falsigemmobacter faecalis]
MSRIIRFEHEGETQWGLWLEEGIRALPQGPYGDLTPSGPVIAQDAVRLLAPVQPRKLICVGLNYRLHAEEANMAIPEEPMIFMVSPEAVIGPDEVIQLDNAQDRIDYEAEIAIVIGTRCRNVAAADAASVVLGYSCANDVSNRVMQKKDGQFTRAKSFDTYKPVGPWIVPCKDPDTLAISLRQNGEVKQASTTGDMIFPTTKVIEFISSIMTLEPGDVIITGTPAGVGPMKSGDLIEVEIEGIGTLSNRVA